MALEVEYLVVAGGGPGGGKGRFAGGGGGGGRRADTGHTVTAQGYSITVGAGGVYTNGADGTNGGNSVFDTITSTGGGHGAAENESPEVGGSGGGGTGGLTSPQAGAAGTAGQGYAGGSGSAGGGVVRGGGGGGGAGAVGGDSTAVKGGDGGAGVASSISGASTYYAGGGGGGAYEYNNALEAPGVGGIGGGADGGFFDTQNPAHSKNATTPTANSGGGGGGNGWAPGLPSGYDSGGSSGADGVVIIRYLTADFGTCTGGTITTDGSYTIHTFTSSGTWTAVAPASSATMKKATVNASDVPATLTNYPSYVDLSRLGITTLAEAQSVRVYADEAKTTEWAREIVSATEMHVKVPSLTSTTEIYVEWDGVSADYAVTDTYGRNAVWTEYDLVMHMENGTTDSTGNHSPSVVGTVSFGDSYGKIKSGSDTLGNSTSYINTGASFATGNTDKSMSCWFNWDTPSTNRGWLIAGGTDSNDQAYGFFVQSVAGLYFHGNGGLADVTISSSVSANTWYHLAMSFTASDDVNRSYLNGTAGATKTRALNTGSSTIRLHLRQNSETGSRYDGSLDEVRIRENGTLSTNWIATEYNNQSDEAGFWGTWTDAGGGGGANPAIMMFF